MTDNPTYTAREIKKMALRMDVDGYPLLIEVVNEELDLYSEDELSVLCQASMIIFTRTLLQGSLKYIK